MRAGGKRAVIAVSTSRFAAASLPVTSPMRRGRRGSGRLRSGANRPSAASFRFSRSSAARCSPSPKRSIERARSRKSPRASNSSGRPKTWTRSPFARSSRSASNCPRGHRHAEARAVRGVLEREEDALPALLAAQLGHLALDPDGRQAREPVADAAVERGHREDPAVAVLDRLDLHARMLRPERRSIVSAPRALRRAWHKLSHFRSQSRAQPASTLTAGGGWKPPHPGGELRRV